MKFINLKEKYNQTIKNELKVNLKLKNIMAVPRLTKIVINRGLGEKIKKSNF